MTQVALDDVSLHLPILGADARLLRKQAIHRFTGGAIAEHATLIVKALENVSFTLQSGDRLGLIGHNGSGKTTLLRLLAGVYAPTAGNLRIEGRVSALLSPGLGMDLDDTGYDNILNIGTLLGMSRSELSSRMDEIAEFTELAAYLALPVRTYSAGMQLRLSFAVVTSIQPDILLLDEGLGVGDARFAHKATERIASMVSRANILVLASHSEAMIHEMCNKVLLLQRGRPMFIGPVDEAFARYRELSEELDHGGG